MMEIKEGKYGVMCATGFVYKFANRSAMDSFITQHRNQLGASTILMMQRVYKEEICYRFIFDIFTMKYISAYDKKQHYIRDGFEVIYYGQRSE